MKVIFTWAAICLISIVACAQNSISSGTHQVLDSPVPQAVVASFSAPDTVCVNTPVTITNTSIGASNYYWNFCVANSSTNPIGTNLGNFGFSLSVFIDYVNDGGRWYAFVTNNMPGKLVRLDFGNSLLNMPTAHDFGNLGGVIPNYCEGIQLVKNDGRWYAIIVGDKPVGRIVKIDFGASLSNNAPIATNWGNIGGLAFPTDLHLFQNGEKWYGLTINAETSTITRFDFTNSFANTPSGTNLGNIGGLNYPTGIYAITKGGKWYAFVSNAGSGDGNSSNSSLARLDFGTSLLNTPTGVNLGNPGNTLRSARDLSIYQSCNEIFGFVVNYSTANDIVRLNFNNDLTTIPSAVSIGNTGNLSFPHCISKLFRVESDLYGFVANVNNNTITRLKFSGCNNVDIPSTSLQNPAPVTYSAPGTYNINLSVDDSLPTQGAICRQVVVLAAPTVATIKDTTICQGESVTLKTAVTGASKVRWVASAGLSDIDVADPVATPDKTTTYVVTATNAGGCVAKDTITVTVRTPAECTSPVVIPSFTMPDTVCVNTPVTITNTSTGASSYYWNFCVADLKSAPTGQNLGNIGGNLSMPVFMDYVLENGRYYGFLINYDPGSLIRLDFGTSLLNTPVSVHLGNFSNIIPRYAEGIQLVKNEGRWYAIIVGGTQGGGSTSRILKIDFGPDITNTTPAATNWGNIGNMNMPIDLHVFKEGNNWFGLTVNSENNTITRFEFSNSFSNTPKAINLGNIGSLSYPTGIYAINDNGYWRVFVVNGGDNTRTNAAFSLTRLDFGSSLLNTPTGVNLGNPGNFLKHPRDLTIFKQCGQIVGFAVNGHFSNSDLIRMDFGTSLSSVPSLSSLGAIGNTSFPHSISKLFRVNEEVYGFVTNVDNNTVTRLRFSGCTNASTPGSQVRNPNPIMYNRAGIYNVNLTVDEGMPTQNAFCKQVVVVPSVHSPVQLKTICAGDSVLLSSTATNGNQWNTGVTEKTIYTKAAGIYWVKSINAGGCMSIDSFKVDVKPMPTVALGRDTSMCNKDSIVLNAGNAGASYLWQNGQTSQHHIASRQGLYFVTVTKDGCITKDSIFISMLPLPMVSIGGKTTICKDGSTELTASGGGNFSWSPATGLSHPFAAVTTASPQVTTKYVLTVTGQNACKAKDSVVISVMPKPVFTATVSRPVLCLGDTVLLTAGGGDSYTWSPTSTLATPGSQITQAFPIKTTSYKVVIENSNCGVKDSIFVRVPVVNKPKVKTTKSNDINCYIGQAQLSTGGGNIYSWKPATGLSDPSSSQPIVRTHTTITYHVSITTAEGCIVEDSITVNVVKGDDGSGFLVPAAFTPNNDGKNDCFGVKYWGEVKDFSMNIYNRWGELLFHADQPSQCWNGMYKGQLQPSDVYVYLIKGKTMCGDIFRKGTVVLVK